MTTILIVEDETIIAEGIEKQLKAVGYAVAGSVVAHASAAPFSASFFT